MSDLFINNVGHAFTVRIGKNLSSVRSAELRVRKPNSVGSATWVSSVSDAVSGELIYITQSGDLANAGIYEAQAFVWESATVNIEGVTFNFEVKNKWE